jgi:phenylpropionate dioxygenase-like ring-hydroxylating dioxygenase large terminal subunit
MCDSPPILRAFSLRARFYTDSSVLELEKSNILARTWQVLGITISPPTQETFITDLLGEPVIAGSRDEGHLTRKAFRWGYHGWTHGVDGDPLGAPEFENAQEFDCERFAPTPGREEWFTLIEAHSLRSQLGPGEPEWQEKRAKC